MPSFAEAAARVVEQKRAGWRNPRQAHDWMASLRHHAFPRIGGMPVSEVTSGDVLETLTPIWHVKATTARCLRQRIRTVLEWAVAMEFRTNNPSDRLGPVLGPQDAVVRPTSARSLGKCLDSFDSTGGRVAQIRIDTELKGQVAGQAERARQARGRVEAAELELPMERGKVLFPDAQIESANAAGVGRPM